MADSIRRDGRYKKGRIVSGGNGRYKKWRIESAGMDIRKAGDKNVAKMHGEEDGKRENRRPIEKK